MLDECESATPRSRNYLPAVGIDDCKRPAVSNRLSEHCTEVLLIRGNESGSFRIAIRINRRFNQTLIRDLASLGELAVL
jgi:hypothetical protein